MWTGHHGEIIDIWIVRTTIEENTTGKRPLVRPRRLGSFIDHAQASNMASRISLVFTSIVGTWSKAAVPKLF